MNAKNDHRCHSCDSKTSQSWQALFPFLATSGEEDIASITPPTLDFIQKMTDEAQPLASVYGESAVEQPRDDEEYDDEENLNRRKAGGNKGPLYAGILFLLVAVVGIVVGGVCGAGHCGNKGSSNTDIDDTNNGAQPLSENATDSPQETLQPTEVDLDLDVLVDCATMVVDIGNTIIIVAFA